MRESIKEFVMNDPWLRPLLTMIAVFLCLTVSIWGPVLEFVLDARDRYQNWRGEQECTS